MFKINAKFMCKEDSVEFDECVVAKVVRLSGAEYDDFSNNLQREYSFIKDSNDVMGWKNGVFHCLLVVGDDRRDGVLVRSEGSNYARYSALIPNAKDLLTAEQSQALTKLNKKLTNIVNYIAEKVSTQKLDGRIGIALEDLESKFNIFLEHTILDTVTSMIIERTEVESFEIDNNDLILYRNMENVKLIAELADPTVTKTDMFAYGYGWDGMIPIGKERAQDIFRKGYEVFQLYDDDSEGVADSLVGIETFKGMFGIEDPEWQAVTEPALEVFILNRESYAAGKVSGEWLKFPATTDDLHQLLERIGINRPSESAFIITAVRVPFDEMQHRISKYDSIDELNMLAEQIAGAEQSQINNFLINLGTDVNCGDTANDIIKLFLPAYHGEIPCAYQITKNALRRIQPKEQESVLAKIRTDRNALKSPKRQIDKSKSKGGLEL